MAQKDGSWFNSEPCHLARRVAIGHAVRNGRPIVFVAIEANEEVQVFGLTPERSDSVAKELRLSAGAARSLMEADRKETP